MRIFVDLKDNLVKYFYQHLLFLMNTNLKFILVNLINLKYLQIITRYEVIKFHLPNDGWLTESDTHIILDAISLKNPLSDNTSFIKKKAHLLYLLVWVINEIPSYLKVFK